MVRVEGGRLRGLVVVAVLGGRFRGLVDFLDWVDFVDFVVGLGSVGLGFVWGGVL